MKAREAADAFVNLFLAGAAYGAWARMIFKDGAAQLSARGLWSLKFFTVLSNLFVGAVAAVMAIRQIRHLRGKGTGVSDRLLTVKLAATAAVALTFTVVMGFLGPMFGYGAMFNGANLWMHLIVPVAAMVQFVVLEADRKLPLTATLPAILPPLLYGTVYYANILINGRTTGPNTNDWYGFAMWGNGIAVLIFGIICAVTYGLAAALRAGNQAVWKHRQKKEAAKGA